MTEWGLANVHTESFPFGRGWQNERFVALAIEPRAYPLIGFPKAWTPGTSGAVTGEAVMADVRAGLTGREPEAYGASLRTSPEARARIQAFVTRKRGS